MKQISSRTITWDFELKGVVQMDPRALILGAEVTAPTGGGSVPSYELLIEEYEGSLDGPRFFQMVQYNVQIENSAIFRCTIDVPGNGMFAIYELTGM